jgi:hypothetical protein
MKGVDTVDIEVDIYIDNIDRTGKITSRLIRPRLINRQFLTPFRAPKNPQKCNSILKPFQAMLMYFYFDLGDFQRTTPMPFMHNI